MQISRLYSLIRYFSHAYRLLPRVRASWSVRFIDENVTQATAADLGWADFIFVSGMHIQAAQIHDIAKRAKRADKVIVLGGPSESGPARIYRAYGPLSLVECARTADDALCSRFEGCAGGNDVYSSLRQTNFSLSQSNERLAV